MGEMNLENQLQVAFATNAELREQIDSLSRVNWSLEERLRHDAESREEMRAFYENQMENLRKEQREALAKLQEQNRCQIDEAVSKITKSFEEQISKLIAERDAALLAVKHQRGKRFGGKSERNKGDGNASRGGENREAEKADFIDAEHQRQKDMEKAAAESSDAKTGETLDAEKLVKKLKRQHPGAEIIVIREDYRKAKSYMDNPEDSHYHKLESYFTLAEGEYFRTGKNGEIEKSCIKILIRYPERYEEHIYEVAHVRSKDKDEYSTSESLDLDRPVPGCMFSKDMLTYVLCEKYLYHTPFRQILKKLRNRGLKVSKSVLGEHVHKAIAWMKDKLQPFWSSLVRKSWILMIDETRTLVGCMDKETDERLELHRQSGYADCGEMMKKAIRYALGEWPAMKRVLECGDVEMSNNLSEQMMRSIKMNLKNAGNIGSEESAKHNAFMFSLIESCKMNKRTVEDYLMSLLDKLKLSRDGDDLTGLLPCNLAT